MQVPSGSVSKGKQRASDFEASTQSAAVRDTIDGNDAGCSQTPEPMAIPSRTMVSRITPNAESDLYQGEEPSNDRGRRPSHNRAKSSLGSANIFDFFGSSSLTSTSTAATSFHFGSPGDSPKQTTGSRVAESADANQRSFFEDNIDADESRISLEDPRLRLAPGEIRDSVNETVNAAHNMEAVDPTDTRLGTTSTPMPPLYPEETLPSYEEAPEYTPPLSQPSGSTSRSKTSAFRAAAADRFLSSRIAKRLNLPPALQSRLQGSQTPEAPSNSQADHHLSATGHLNGRMRFVRSDSAPNLTHSTQSHGLRRIEVHDYAATAYVDGARMGPAPRRPRPASSRPSTAGTDVVRPHSNVVSVAPPSTRTGTAGHFRRPPGASPLLCTAVSSVNSSRRNSDESRPSSCATTSSAPNGGLFTCGYSSSHSGATTPTRPSPLRKGRSRNVSLRNLGDLLSLNREPDRSSPNATAESAQQHAEDPLHANEPSSSSTMLREVVSPISQELLISARVRSHPSVRPTLMNAARSSPQAGVDAEASGIPVLILPRQNQERKPDPLQNLPREVIITIFKSLVDLHVKEHKNAIKDGVWRGTRSNEMRWYGAEAAARELARLSRVSRAWQSYVLDGQLWQKLEFSKFPDMAEEAMISIAKSVGPFVRCLDLHGLAGLRSSILVALSKAQRPRPLTDRELAASACVPAATSQLEELDLQGCRQISTSALNTVLSHSPNLKKCRLGSLPCVDNTTLCILAAMAVNLEYLDVSRCRSIDGEGIRAFFAIQETETNISAVSKERNVGSRFRELHASGVSGFDKVTLAQLGRHWPNLEVLDLSYCSDVNNAAVAAMVSSEGDVVSEKGSFVTLTPRQAGSHEDEEVVRRSFPCLKRLNLSSCRALTDRACTSLSHAVPMLEVLELANIGPALKDAGLIKLFATTTQLKKLDLERATQITDAVITALTPPESHAEAFGLAVPDRDTLLHGMRPRSSLLNLARRSASRRRHDNRPASTAREDAPPYDEDAVAALIPATGTHLTHLMLSSASHLTAEAILLLINRCPFLLHLEVDDTHADNDVAIQFVQLARYRKVRNAYLSLVDCRSFSRDTYSHLNGDTADSGVRPRRGSRGYAFRQFCYDDPEPCLATTAVCMVSAEGATQRHGEHSANVSGGQSSLEGHDRDRGHDECNDIKPVVKSFWGWQLVDARIKQKRKAEQRAAANRRQGGRGKVSSVVAMAFGLSAAAEDESSRGAITPQMRALRGGGPSWSRALVGRDGTQAGGGDVADNDDDDARGCTIM